MSAMDRPPAVARHSILAAAVGAALAGSMALHPPEASAQSPEVTAERPVFAFLAELADHRCEIREAWPNGQPFRLDTEFAFLLDDRIVTVDSFIVDEEGRRSPRNHGIRAYPQETEDARFWEFDYLGGVTEGSVWVEAGTLHYEYAYNGQTLRDSWSPSGGHAYDFKVRVWEDGDWGATYMDGTYYCKPISASGG